MLCKALMPVSSGSRKRSRDCETLSLRNLIYKNIDRPHEGVVRKLRKLHLWGRIVRRPVLRVLGGAACLMPSDCPVTGDWWLLWWWLLWPAGGGCSVADGADEPTAAEEDGPVAGVAGCPADSVSACPAAGGGPLASAARRTAERACSAMLHAGHAAVPGTR